MEKKLLRFGVLILLVLLLTACSSKPEDVSQDLWDRGIQYTLYIDKLTNEEESLPDGLGDELNDLITNDTEQEIVVGIHTLSMASILHTVASKFGSNSDEAKKNYDEKYKELEEIFGTSNLKSSKLDEELVSGMIAENVSKLQAESNEIKTTFMQTTGVNLEGREVQFDLANNLDKDFYLDGTVELCDYYNYGYTNETSYFCGQITPIDGGYSDSWYLYFHRESFGSFYDALLKSNVDAMIVAKIPSANYERGQDNMAVVQSLKVY